MSKASGTEIKTSIFIPPLFTQKFPNWNRWHLAKTALNILEKVEKLHQYNIILGDINPSNILLNNENDIYFIDTDSFQIEDYPCSVGMVPYTRKIHHGKRYESYLRTKNDDIYAIATLVFQLMLPGKLPYSFSGGGSEKENMKPENFPYKCYDGKGYNNAPDGQWVYIWSHLPKKLKLLFCRIFKKNENISLSELIKEMKSYIWQLEQGHQTNDIFPLTYKQIDNNGNILKDDFTEFKCKICGNKFAIPNKRIEEFKAKGWKLPTKCDICKNIKDHDLKKCAKCGKTFKDKYNNLCKKCRDNNSNNNGGFLSSLFGGLF
jgi:serine/threonine protein kinase